MARDYISVISSYATFYITLATCHSQLSGISRIIFSQLMSQIIIEPH